MLRKQWWFVLVLVIVAALVDRYTKAFFVQQPLYGLSLGGGVVVLQYYLNTAMAFSLPLFPLVYFSLVLLVIAVLIRQMIQAVRQQRWSEVTVGTFILLGALSNLFDRWRYGGVVDFIHTPLGSIFNLADMYIVVAMIVWAVMLYGKQKVSQNISTTH